MDRKLKMLNMRIHKKMTYVEIGKEFGISHQGVQFMLKKHFPDQNPKQVKFRQTDKLVCGWCKKDFTRYKGMTRHKKTFCSHACYWEFKKDRRTPEEKRLAYNARMSKFYHGKFKSNPNWKEIIRLRNLRQKIKKEEIDNLSECCGAIRTVHGLCSDCKEPA